MIKKDRLVAITDGIIAVAATVMVLQLDVPGHASLAAVSAQWPTLLAYIISFTQIFLAWHEHHDAFLELEYVNHRVFLMNCLWLLFITMIPFVTGMVGQSMDNSHSVLLYIFILFMEKLVIMLECRLISRSTGRKIHDDAIIRKLRMISFAGYAAAAALALVKPTAALGVIILVSIANIVLICCYDAKEEKKEAVHD